MFSDRASAPFDLHHDDRGSGEPFLLLHGFTGASADWEHVFDLASLAKERRVIRMDLRGHGRSAPLGEARFTHAACAEDVLSMLDRLRLARVEAIGLSAGANTLLHLSSRWPDRVDRMVLVSATPRYPDQARAIMRGFALGQLPEDEQRAVRARHVHGPEQIEALFAAARRFADDQDDMAFEAETLSAIRARTLIVNGDRDPLYPVELSIELFRGIGGASLWILPDAGHVPVFAAHREAFAAGALAYLSSRVGHAESRAPMC